VRLRFESGLVHQREALDAVLAEFAGGRVPDPPRLQVEMETGTGKTYVYLRLVHELHRRHGWSRFVVVVPSIAIREGVRSAMALLEDHLARLYDGARIRPLVYHSRRIGDLREFALSPDLQVLVMNIDAFNKDANLVRREHDAFHGQRPIDLIRQVAPVVLVDEPQRLGRQTARRAIDDLGPRVVIGWSATPPDTDGLVYRLDPARAFELDLVKRIDVAAVEEGPEAQVRAAVRIQLEKELLFARLRPGGPRIKVLTLFFLDRVADYDQPEGRVRRWFLDAWQRELASGRWHELSLPDVEQVHGGYFARDRAGGAKDTRGRSAADGHAYELIMRDKTGLLDPDEPLRFIFSHSALREGWDNPNVFVVCTLNRGKGTVRRRQELGRGLRLPVDEAGRRVRDPRLAVLTVVADDAYARFAAGLQDELRHDGHELGSWQLRDHWERRPLTLQRGWRSLPGLAELWARLARPFGWHLHIDRDRLVQESVRRLAELQLTGQPEPRVPELLASLAERTGLTRPTLTAILTATPDLATSARRPGFVEAAADAIRLAVDAAIADGVRYRPGAGSGPDLDRLGAEALVGYRSRLVPCPACIHGELPVDEPWERGLIAALSARDDLRVLLAVPPWLELATPLGPARPRWAAALADGRFVAIDPAKDVPPPLAAAQERALAARGVVLVRGRLAEHMPPSGSVAALTRGRDQ
jgi:hypothetical protein